VRIFRYPLHVFIGRSLLLGSPSLEMLSPPSLLDTAEERPYSALSPKSIVRGWLKRSSGVPSAIYMYIFAGVAFFDNELARPKAVASFSAVTHSNGLGPVLSPSFALSLGCSSIRSILMDAHCQPAVPYFAPQTRGVPRCILEIGSHHVTSVCDEQAAISSEADATGHGTATQAQNINAHEKSRMSLKPQYS